MQVEPACGAREGLGVKAALQARQADVVRAGCGDRHEHDVLRMVMAWIRCKLL